MSNEADSDPTEVSSPVEVETISNANVWAGPATESLDRIIMILPIGARLTILETRAGPGAIFGRFAFSSIDKITLHRAGQGWLAMKWTKPVVAPHPPITFTANPTTIKLGQSTTLTYFVQGVNAVYRRNHVDDPWRPASGEDNGQPVNETYTPSKVGTVDCQLRVVFRDNTEEVRTQRITVNSVPVPPPTPPPSTEMRIGVNCLDDAAAARLAYEYGCRFFLIMNNYGVARELADKGATVLFRQYVNGWKLDGDQIVDRVLEAAGYSLSPHVIHTLWNEYDSWGIGTVKECVDWANYTRRAVERILGYGAKVAIGTIPVGNPDITKPEIRQAMKDNWSGIYNMSDRVYWDQHTYSGNMAHTATRVFHPGPARGPDMAMMQSTMRRVEVQTGYKHTVTGYAPNIATFMEPDRRAVPPVIDLEDWYETRWRWYLWECGFDPNARRMLSGETGIDEGGIGGFPAHNATPAQVVGWCRWYRNVQTCPVVVDGRSYPSPFIGGAIFQCGGNAGWQGYNVIGHLAAMRDAGVW